MNEDENKYVEYIFALHLRVGEERENMRNLFRMGY